MNVTKHDQDSLAERFEAQRAHLQAVAYRILDSLDEADDAVQEAWLRLSRSEAESLENLKGWLTVVVVRVCLNMLRSRKARREEPLDTHVLGPLAGPEPEALLADSVGVALLVVFDTLGPPERIAFVLHDMFAVPFDEIAPIVGCSPTAARQLASRGRRRLQGVDRARTADLAPQRKVVDAFLAASRKGDFEALLALLDPDIVMRPDPAAIPMGAWPEIRGAPAVGRLAVTLLSRRKWVAKPALVNGAVGIAVVPGGRLLLAMIFSFRRRKIVAIDVIAAPASSGFAKMDGTVVIPCSMQTLSGIVHSYDDDLVMRAGDETPQESQRLILVVREPPLDLRHLRPMAPEARSNAFGELMAISKAIREGSQASSSLPLSPGNNISRMTR